MKPLHFFIVSIIVVAILNSPSISLADLLVQSGGSKTQFQLKVNQTFLLESANIQVKFLNVTADSRCPSDVTCIWQGETKVLVNVMYNNTTNENFILTTNSAVQNSSKIVGDYVIRVSQIDPYPLSGKKISLSDYVVTFEITKSGILSPLKQFQSGIAPRDVKCNSGFELIFKASDGSPVCVTSLTGQKLVERGWATHSSETSEIVKSTKIVTLDQNNHEIVLSKGQRFLLNLGSNYDWSLNIDNNTVISQVPNVMVMQGAQGLFESHVDGKTTLTATGDPPCLQSVPRCGMPSILFKLDIIVS